MEQTRARLHDESVLVIVLAETRAYEHTFSLFRRNVLQELGADLALCVAKNAREVPDNPFYESAKYIWQYDEPDDWGEAFDDIQSQAGLNDNWRILLEVKDQWLGGVQGEGSHPGSAGILLFFRLFLKQSLIKSGVVKRYDRFIITRSDFVHRVPHVPLRLLPPDFIWIPDGEDYGGYTDRHIVAQRRDILNVLSIADRIISDPVNLYADMKFSQKWNLEKYIKWSFKQMGLASRVKRYPYTMYSVRSVDGHTRWRKGEFNKSLGYFVKYQGEYENYRIASFLVGKYSGWTAAKVRAFYLIRSFISGTFFKKLLKQFKRLN